MIVLIEVLVHLKQNSSSDEVCDEDETDTEAGPQHADNPSTASPPVEETHLTASRLVT